MKDSSRHRVIKALRQILTPTNGDSPDEEDVVIEDKDRKWMAESCRLARNRYMDDLAVEPEELEQI